MKKVLVKLSMILVGCILISLTANYSYGESSLPVEITTPETAPGGNQSPWKIIKFDIEGEKEVLIQLSVCAKDNDLLSLYLDDRWLTAFEGKKIKGEIVGAKLVKKLSAGSHILSINTTGVPELIALKLSEFATSSLPVEITTPETAPGGNQSPWKIIKFDIEGEKEVLIQLSVCAKDNDLLSLYLDDRWLTAFEGKKIKGEIVGAKLVKKLSAGSHILSVSTIGTPTIINLWIIPSDYQAPLIAKITSPKHNSITSSKVTIFGTATCGYELLYGTGTLPTSWFTLATATTQIINGTLATWNTMQIADGTYTICLVVKDKSGNTATDTVTVGIDNSPPVAEITFPTANSIITSVGTIAIIGTATDKHLLNYTLEYSPGYTPQTYTSIASSTISVISGTLGNIYLPVGSYTFLLTVRDIANNIATQCVSFIIISMPSPPTPEEIFYKVAANFGKIEDMKAKMIDWGTATLINQNEGTLTETFGPTERIFMQKSPNKVRIEIPSKNTIFIINQNIWYMQSPEIGTQKIDTSEVEDVFSSPLSLYSPFSESKEGYDERIKEYKGEGIYVLEITPITKECKAEKIVLEVNYNNGVIVKTEGYDADGNIVIRTEVKEIMLVNGIWLPTRYVETKFVDELVVATEAFLSEIAINTGISDAEFEMEVEE